MDQRLLESGAIVVKHLMNGEFCRPPPGFKWLLLGGMIHHITATSSNFYICHGDIQTGENVFHAGVTAGFPDTEMPLFSAPYSWTVTPATGTVADWRDSGSYCPYVLNNNMSCVFYGDATAHCDLEFLQVREKP